MARKLPFGISLYSYLFHSYWFLRLLQMLMVLIGMGLTGAEFSFLKGKLGCKIPPRIAFSFALYFLSFLALIPIALLDGPYRIPFTRNWFQISFIARFSFDAILFLLWIGGAVSSVVPCSELCSACAVNFEPNVPFAAWMGSLSCGCNGANGDQMRQDGQTVKAAEGHYFYESNMGVAAFVVLTFSILAVCDLFQPAMLRRIRRFDGTSDEQAAVEKPLQQEYQRTDATAPDYHQSAHTQRYDIPGHRAEEESYAEATEYPQAQSYAAESYPEQHHDEYPPQEYPPQAHSLREDTAYYGRQ